MIDPHVHLRDAEWAYKGTIVHELEVAEAQGVEKVFDMPNLKNPIIRKNDLVERLKLVPEDKKHMYYTYLGLTADKEQIKEALFVYRDYAEVIGFKLFAGKSVGPLAVISEKDQHQIYGYLSDLGYFGVLPVHCEKEAFMKNDIWDPKNPITHALARPKQAEIESIKDQIKFAIDTGFEGVLHICHVSCPESVEMINEARESIYITCGVTPHHIMWSDEMLRRPDGLIYKMNPPLRSQEDVIKLREQLKQGKIDWIETDHAPHAVGEKLFPPYMSGYPTLYLYKQFVTEFLPNLGISQEQIKKLTQDNIVKAFSDKPIKFLS